MSQVLCMAQFHVYADKGHSVRESRRRGHAPGVFSCRVKCEHKSFLGLFVLSVDPQKVLNFRPDKERSLGTPLIWLVGASLGYTEDILEPLSSIGSTIQRIVHPK